MTDRTHYGQARFAEVLAEAARLAEAKNNHAETIRKQRSDELQKLAAEIDDRMDLRRNRAERDRMWAEHGDQVIEQFVSGVSADNISKTLADIGFSVHKDNVIAWLDRKGYRRGQNC